MQVSEENVSRGHIFLGNPVLPDRIITSKHSKVVTTEKMTRLHSISSPDIQCVPIKSIMPNVLTCLFLDLKITCYKVILM